eukprot:117583-Heterocapsa_arctica.AAC.1
MSTRSPACLGPVLLVLDLLELGAPLPVRQSCRPGSMPSLAGIARSEPPLSALDLTQLDVPLLLRQLARTGLPFAVFGLTRSEPSPVVLD